MLKTASASTKLDPETITYAMEISLQEAVCTYFGVKQCEVNMYFQTIQPTFRVPDDMLIEEAELFKPNAIWGDLIYPEFTFEMLHEDIIKHCQDLFPKNLRIAQATETFKKWIKMKSQIVEGEIDEVLNDKIIVNLNTDDVQGIMRISEWVPAEISMYKRGKKIQFLILNVVQNKSLTKVYLSRASKKFPVALLQIYMDSLKLKPLKRLQGKICWIKSNLYIPKKILNKVRQELRGERIIIVLEENKAKTQ